MAKRFKQKTVRPNLAPSKATSKTLPTGKHEKAIRLDKRLTTKQVDLLLKLNTEVVNHLVNDHHCEHFETIKKLALSWKILKAAR